MKYFRIILRKIGNEIFFLETASSYIYLYIYLYLARKKENFHFGKQILLDATLNVLYLNYIIEFHYVNKPR